MAKAKELIPLYKRPTIRGLREELREYREGYAQSQKDLAAMTARNAENHEWKTDARTNAAEWRTHAEKLKKENESLNSRLNGINAQVAYLQGQLDRCIGYIAAHHNEHPAPEAMPTKVETRAVDEYLDRAANRPGGYTKIRTWRDDLGIKL